MLNKKKISPCVVLVLFAFLSSNGWSQTSSKELSRQQKFDAKLQEQMESRRKSYREYLRMVTEQMAAEPSAEPSTEPQKNIPWPGSPELSRSGDWGWQNNQRPRSFDRPASLYPNTIHSSRSPATVNAPYSWGYQGNGIFLFPNAALYSQPVFGNRGPRLQASDANAIRSIINRDITRQQNLNARFNPIMAGQIRADQFGRDLLRLNRNLRRRDIIESRLLKK